ncbi:hypothetical protein [Wukongibacter sp. M2B1]
MKKRKGKNKTHTKSIGTPLGHIKINSEIVDKPVTEQVKDLLDEDK